MEMIERKEPKFVEFTDGELVEGVLTAIQQIEMKDKQNGKPRKVTRFVLAEGEIEDDKFNPSGDSVCFLGTYQLNSTFRLSDRGHFVSVRCEGTDSSVTKNGNAMKKFKIFVSAKPLMQAAGTSAATDNTFITDDDIPF